MKNVTIRRLRRVILTLPTATPSQEQAIVKSKVSGALKMVWDRMVHWGNGSHSNQPDLLIDWDEARDRGKVTIDCQSLDQMTNLLAQLGIR